MATGPAAKPVNDWQTVQPDDWEDVSTPSAPPTLGQQAMDYARNTALPAASDFFQGIGAGALHTLSNVGEMERRYLPNWVTGLHNPTPSEAEDLKKITTPPDSDAGKIGYGGEQGAEFMLPGAAETEGATGLAKVLPRIGKYAEPAARIATSALSSGAVNKAQGGNFSTGAALGAGGEVAGQGLKKIAPVVTEFAQGIHTPGAKSGKAILNETSSIFPGAVRRSAQNVLDRLNPEMQNAVDKVNTPVDLAPARQVAAQGTAKAYGRNEPKMYKGVQRLERIVNEDLQGNPIPQHVPPHDALELRRGVDTALPKGSFNPASTNAFKGYRTPLRDALNEGIGQVVPEYRPLAKRISALIPATEPSKGGFGHLWGPGAGAIFGGYYGARAGARNEGGFTGAVKGGLQGAAEGATAGTLLPAALNTGARAMYSRVLPKVIVGTAAQATHRRAK